MYLCRSMKKLMMKISAMLLVVWYCMSIIGFDVHTCKGSGQTFVVTFAESNSCADIHPEHHCCKSHAVESHCCQSEDHCCDLEHSALDVQKCCSNEYQMILLSGCRSSVESDYEVVDIESICINIPIYSLSDYAASLHVENLQFWDPYIGCLRPCDRQATYGVWII